MSVPDLSVPRGVDVVARLGISGDTINELRALATTEPETARALVGEQVEALTFDVWVEVLTKLALAGVPDLRDERELAHSNWMDLVREASGK